jgi:hypothetical protein
MQQDELLSIISDIENECRQAHTEPVCAPFVEIDRRCTPEQRKTLRDDLNELYAEGKIRVWQAINDTIIKLIENGI